jgi:anthranilate phosphoribosyltransferase
MFNYLGPLCNPAGATHQLLGTSRADMQDKLAQVLQKLGTSRSIVVRGEDGQDEVTLDGMTRVVEVCGDGNKFEHHWSAETFGLSPASIARMQATDPRESAAIILGIFAGHTGPCRDIVIANAAAGLWLVEKTATPLEGAKLAAKLIDSGAAAEQLDRFTELNSPPPDDDRVGDDTIVDDLL